jgi:hypothetical protein
MPDRGFGELDRSAQASLVLRVEPFDPAKLRSIGGECIYDLNGKYATWETPFQTVWRNAQEEALYWSLMLWTPNQAN